MFLETDSEIYINLKYVEALIIETEKVDKNQFKNYNRLYSLVAVMNSKERYKIFESPSLYSVKKRLNNKLSTIKRYLKMRPFCELLN
jgi:hypothetical protein